MKKRIAAMVIGVMAAMSAFGMVAAADEAKNPVVDVVNYKPADGIVKEASVIWYDEAGNEYRNTIKTVEEKPASVKISSQVSWTDEAGNVYVSDEAAHTVTVYDCSGNVLAVRAQ